ncbi:MAG: hypothetical protein ACFCUN_02065 [Hyphomicrobiaceae bacterium]
MRGIGTTDRSGRGGKGAPTDITIPGRSHPYLLVLTPLSAAVMIAGLALFFTNELPLFFMPFLLLTITLATFVLVATLKEFQPVKLKLNPHGLEVSSGHGKRAFAWSQLESVRVVGATGSLGDNPLIPAEKRLGLAVFLKNGTEGRLEANQADAILASADPDFGERLVEISRNIMKVAASRQRIGSGGRKTGMPDVATRRLGVVQRAG